MIQRTKITFFGVLAPPYAGATRKGTSPTDPKAIGWHVVVGGVQCSIETKEDFAKHFKDFLDYAYQAGVDDTKAVMRERLGL